MTLTLHLRPNHSFNLINRSGIPENILKDTKIIKIGHGDPEIFQIDDLLKQPRPEDIFHLGVGVIKISITYCIFKVPT